MKIRAGIILLLLLSGSYTTVAQVKSVGGILDLRQTGIPESPVEMRGEWEFYWRKHILPVEFKSGDAPRPTIMGKVPAYWTSYGKDIPLLSGDGFATYRLRILLPPGTRDELMLDLPAFDSAYRLYVNGKYIDSNGVAGSTPETSKPDYRPFTYSFTPEKDVVEIVVNVSNFHHRRGGFWQPIVFGEKHSMELTLERREILDNISNGMLLAFGGFFFMFYLLLRSDRTMLYFALSTIMILVRSLFTGRYEILYFFDIPWNWLIRIEYISSFLAVTFGMWYFYFIYRDRIVPWISTALTSLFAIFIALTLFSPVSTFSYTIIPFMPLTITVIGYYLVRSFIVSLREPGYRSLISAGFIVLLIGAVNDMTHSAGGKLLSSSYILSHALVFFIMMQVIVLIYRWILSAREEKRLLEEIDNVNRNLESIVIERTSELTNQKSELERQKNETESKNLELEKTILVKNRIFSIIAHDLRSPVLNLSLMIDHLREHDDPDTRRNVIQSISQQARLATNLISNLLLWGEGQQNRINYNPGKVNLTDIILENFNLFQESADRKRIKLSYSHKGDPVAICDRELLDMVIRNLISNSIKFTRRSGNVIVTVEEPGVRDGMIYIKIKDNGVGMEQEKVDRITGSDMVESSPGTENEKGTGLGLQLCIDLIRINKGSLAIESEPGRGTVITIMLPSPTRS